MAKTKEIQPEPHKLTVVRTLKKQENTVEKFDEPNVFQRDWSLNKSDRFRVNFVTKVGDVPTVIRRVKIKATSTHVSFGKRTFIIDINQPAYRVKNTIFYIVDLHEGQLRFGSGDTKIDPKLLHEVVNSSLAKQLVAGLENAPMIGNIIMVCMGIGLGVAVGYIIGNYAPL